MLEDRALIVPPSPLRRYSSNQEDIGVRLFFFSPSADVADVPWPHFTGHPYTLFQVHTGVQHLGGGLAPSPMGWRFGEHQSKDTRTGDLSGAPALPPGSCGHLASPLGWSWAGAVSLPRTPSTKRFDLVLALGVLVGIWRVGRGLFYRDFPCSSESCGFVRGLSPPHRALSREDRRPF